MFNRIAAKIKGLFNRKPENHPAPQKAQAFYVPEPPVTIPIRHKRGHSSWDGYYIRAKNRHRAASKSARKARRVNRLAAS